MVNAMKENEKLKGMANVMEMSFETVFLESKSGASFVWMLRVSDLEANSFGSLIPAWQLISIMFLSRLFVSP